MQAFDKRKVSVYDYVFVPKALINEYNFAIFSGRRRRQQLDNAAPAFCVHFWNILLLGHITSEKAEAAAAGYDRPA
jgi:hypothetical protein